MAQELIIGNGFIGQAYKEHALSQGRDVHTTSRRPDENNPNEHYMDLATPETIARVLDEVQPEVIVNCAAILDSNDNPDRNSQFTRNLLEVSRDINPDLFRVVILGSGGEYGPVEDTSLPIHEDAPRNPINDYCQSKKKEVDTALDFSSMHGLPIVVGRVFNPLGIGLRSSNLTSRVLEQVRDIQEGSQDPTITVRNLEAARDYMHVRDCVRAIGLLAHTERLHHNVYNIGSGVSTSNQAIIKSILRHTDMPDVGIRATDTSPEPVMGATQADITRLIQEGYSPHYSIDDTIAEMVAEAGLSPGSHQAVA